jgi:hypothetical protein
MASIASLLNPVGPEEPAGTGPPSRVSLSPASTHGSLPPSHSTQPYFKKAKMAKDGAVFIKGKIKGELNFPAFDCLGEGVLEELREFQIFPLGTIQEYARHIPYNSERKNFLEKTGRESFEGTSKFTRFPNIPLLTSGCSPSVYLQAPGRREGIPGDVGL